MVCSKTMSKYFLFLSDTCLIATKSKKSFHHFVVLKQVNYLCSLSILCAKILHSVVELNHENVRFAIIILFHFNFLSFVTSNTSPCVVFIGFSKITLNFQCVVISIKQISSEINSILFKKCVPNFDSQCSHMNASM